MNQYNIFKYLNKRNDQPGESLEEANIQFIPAKTVLLQHGLTKQYYYYPAFNPYAFDTTNKNLHEVIMSYMPQALRLDLDHIPNDQTYQDDIIRVAEEVATDMWPDHDFINKSVVIERAYETENCYHVKLNGFVPNVQSVRVWANKFQSKLPHHLKPYVDAGTYRKGSCLQLAGCIKNGVSSRIITPGSTFKDTLMTWVDDTLLRDVSTELNPETIHEDYLDLSLNKPMLKAALALINREYPDINKEFNISHIAGSNIITYNRIVPSYCPICKRDHSRAGCYFTVQNKKVTRHCHRMQNRVINVGKIKFVVDERVPYIEKLDKMIGFMNNNQNKLIIQNSERLKDQLRNTDEYIMIDSERLPQYPLNASTVAVCCNMGGGKTAMLSELLNRMVLSDEQIVTVLAFRISFTGDIVSKLNKAVRGLNLKNYIKAKKGKLESPHNAVQAESAHRIVMNQTHDVVIIDETESFLQQVQGRTFRDSRHNQASYANIEALIREAKQLIIMDANLSADTLDYIKRVRGGKITLLNNTYQRRKGINGKVATEPELLYKRIITDVNAGKSTVVCDNRGPKSCETLLRRVKKECPGLKDEEIKIYSSKHPSGKDFNDITQALKGIKLLIYTSSLVAGVSYEVKDHFDTLYAFLYNTGPSVDSSRQMMRRVRHFINPTYYVCLINQTHMCDNIGPKTKAGADYVLKRGLNNGLGKFDNEYDMGTFKMVKGDRVYNTSDPYYHLYVNSWVARTKSIIYFGHQFLGGEALTGVQFDTLTPTEDEQPEIKDGRRETKIIKKCINNEAAESISEAENITREECESLQDKHAARRELTLGEKDSMSKYFLMMLYGLHGFKFDMDKLDVLLYQPKAMKYIYKNLKFILSGDSTESVIEKLSDEVITAAFAHEDEDTKRKGRNFLSNREIREYYDKMRLSLTALDLIGFGDVWDRMDDEIINDTVEINRVDLFNNMSAKLKPFLIKEDPKYIKILYGNSRSGIAGIDKWADAKLIRNGLLALNPIFKTMFGLQITQKGRKTRADRDMFVVKSNLNSQFRYERATGEDFKRYSSEELKPFLFHNDRRDSRVLQDFNIDTLLKENDINA